MKKKQLDFLYDKKMVCPVCLSKFNARTVKNGKSILVSTELNLRPIYKNINPIVYDVLLCDACGYAAPSRQFNQIYGHQIERVKEKISMKYISRKYPPVYDYKIALERYKLALYNAFVIEHKNSDKAYLCLRISWIIEEIKSKTTDEQELEKLELEYINYSKNAFKWFTEAYSSIVFPIYGMDESTYHYLLGALSFEMKDLKMARIWIGKVLISTTSSKRLKDKARELKELIKV